MEYGKILLTLVLFAGFAYADVIPEGEHPVTNNIYIDNIDEYPLYKFFIYPTSMSGGAAWVETTKVPGFYKFAQPKLYAVEAETVLDITAENFTPPETALVSDNTFGLISTLPDSDSRSEVDTHYSITPEIGKGRILLTQKSVTPEPQPQKELDYVLLLVTLGIGLIVGYLAGKKL